MMALDTTSIGLIRSGRETSLIPGGHYEQGGEGNGTDGCVADGLEDKSGPSVAKQARKFRNSAIYRLAKREHSCYELDKKLKERFPEFDHGLIEGVLTRLQNDGQLSDQRFTESYIRMRWRKGFGPQRIARELQERGISELMVAPELANEQYDWYLLAVEVRLRKFGAGEPVDFKSRMKQQSFLYYRGFETEQIQSAFC